MQLQSLCSSPAMSAPVPRPLAGVATAPASEQCDVADIGGHAPAPSCENSGAATAVAVASPPSPVVVARAASPQTILLEEPTAEQAAPQGVNLQQAVQDAASSAGLSEAGAAEVLREVSGEGGDPNQVREKITNIVAEQLKVEKDLVTDEATFQEDLGADSLDTVEVLMAIQEEFGFDSISDEDAQGITTVGDAIAYVQKRLSNGEGGGEDLF